MNSLMSKHLEDVSEIIRKKLQIPNDLVLCSADLDLIINRIHDCFPQFEITAGQEMSFHLKDKHFITITYDNNMDIDSAFDFVVHSFCYGTLLDKEKLQSYESENLFVGEDVIMNDKYTSYLTTAVLLPKEQFFHDIVGSSRSNLENSGSLDSKVINKKYKSFNFYSGYNF